jgi:UDP-glucose 4-epimerase
MSKRILVTGGAGYVGSACLRHLLSSGLDAIAYDNLVQGHRESVPAGKLIVGDIADTHALTLAMRKMNADAVMHFAAATYVGESVDNPEYHYRNNIAGTLSLLNAMRSAGVKRMLFSNDYPPPDGTCIRDYVHVDDLAQAHRLAIEATTPQTREVFNIGTGTGSSVFEVIRAAEQVTGQQIPFDVVARRPGDPPALVASPKKLIEKLGWNPHYTNIVQIVHSAWKWHESHPQGYRTQAAVAV